MAADPLTSASVRAFLAIPLADIFSQELNALLQPLRHRISGVRWIDPGEAHLTLHFFGAIAAKEIDVVDAFSKKIALFFSPLVLSLDALGGFPNLEKPNVLWVGVAERTRQLKPLQEAIRGQARALGFRSESRPFLPHATIGRVKEKGLDLRSLPAAKASALPRGEKIADHFALYQSHCSSEGTRYEILKTYPLSKKT